MLKSIPSGENVNQINTQATAVLIEDTLWIEPEDLTNNQGYELPSVNLAYFGKPYRYYYAAGMYDPGPFRNTVSENHT